VTPNERRIERIVALAFAITMVTGVALLVVYASGGQTQIEGVLLAICLASIGIGIVVWAEYLMNTPISIEARHPFASSASDPALSEVLDEEAGFTRRRLLVGMLFGALAGLGAALAIPALSLGPAPGRELFTTSWAPGKRLVDINGVAVRAADLPVGSITTVFPEGDPGSDAEASERRRLVVAALSGLPAEQREALELGYFGGLSQSEIAERTGQPLGTVKTRMRLALQKLRSQLQVLGSEGEGGGSG